MFVLGLSDSEINPKDYKCDECPKRFSKESRLKVHIRNMHDGRYTNKCDFCGQTKSTSKALKIHIRNIHEGHNCNICRKSLRSAAILKRHILSAHEKDKDFTCNFNKL